MHIHRARAPYGRNGTPSVRRERTSSGSLLTPRAVPNALRPSRRMAAATLSAAPAASVCGKFFGTLTRRVPLVGASNLVGGAYFVRTTIFRPKHVNSSATRDADDVCWGVFCPVASLRYYWRCSNVHSQVLTGENWAITWCLYPVRTLDY